MIKSFLKYFKVPFIFFTVLIIISLISFNKAWSAPLKDVALVIVNGLNFRLKPGKNNPVLKSLKKGTIVNILEYEDKWLKVEHAGVTGYIVNMGNYVIVLKSGKNSKNETQSNENKSDENIGRVKRQAQDIIKEIDKHQAEIKSYSKEESNIIDSLNSIDLLLNKAQKKVLLLQREVTALSIEREKNKEVLNSLSRKIEVAEEYATKRLVSFYKLIWLGKLPFLASSESIFQFFERKRGIEYILKADEKVLDYLLNNKKEQSKLLKIQDQQKRDKQRLEAEINKHIQIILSQKTKRKKLLASIRRKKDLAKQAISALEIFAKKLDQKIKDLSKKTDDRDSTQYIKGLNFSALKGLLKMPVKGKIISPFGLHRDAKLNIKLFRSGIDIKAERGEPIIAVSDGIVSYANWFRGYGNMIIINHGDNYYSVYAHMEEFFKKSGDRVEADEVIATVGETGSLTGGPGLYFELRYHGKPIDPLKWINLG